MTFTLSPGQLFLLGSLAGALLTLTVCSLQRIFFYAKVADEYRRLLYEQIEDHWRTTDRYLTFLETHVEVVTDEEEETNNLLN